MASALQDAVQSLADSVPPAPTLREVLSGIFGSISLTAWICLLLPQLLANYRAKSADGLSMTFLFVWLFGDIMNMFGTFYTDLAPTAVALAGYFCLSDLVLIVQCLYYNAVNAHRARRRRPSEAERREGVESQGQEERTTTFSEESPLLSSQSASFDEFPPYRTTPADASLATETPKPLSHAAPGSRMSCWRTEWVVNVLSILAVHLLGAVAWYISYRAGAWKKEGEAQDGGGGDSNAGDGDVSSSFGVFLGYCSAVLYLVARLPQIYKNYREKSCEGLALLFFLLSLVGNWTFGVSLLVYSSDPGYLVTTIPWLLGSMGTMVEDMIIFWQFRAYSHSTVSSLP